MASPEITILLIILSSFVTSSADLPTHLVGKSEMAFRNINRNQEHRQLPRISARQRSESSDRLHLRPTLVMKHGKVKMNKFNPSLIRPSASDDLPILPLQYPHSRETLPKGGDLDQETLSELLGADYDPAFMSPSRPPESLASPNGSYAYQ